MKIIAQSHEPVAKWGAFATAWRVHHLSIARPQPCVDRPVGWAQQLPLHGGLYLFLIRLLIGVIEDASFASGMGIATNMGRYTRILFFSRGYPSVLSVVWSIPDRSCTLAGINRLDAGYSCRSARRSRTSSTPRRHSPLSS